MTRYRKLFMAAATIALVACAAFSPAIPSSHNCCSDRAIMKRGIIEAIEALEAHDAKHAAAVLYKTAEVTGTELP